MVDFETLKPKPLMNLFGIEVDLGWLDGSKFEGQYAVYMDTYLIYGIALAVFVVFLLIAIMIGTIFRKYKKQIYKQLENLKDKLIWNGIIQSISIAYLNQAIGVFLIFNLLFNQESQSQGNMGFIVSALILVSLICYKIMVGRYTYKNKAKLSD